MARLEYKYFVPEEYMDSLRQDISPFLKNDRFAEAHHKKEYTVRSIYLDSYRLHTYEEKVLGMPQRNKFRIRGYDEPENDPLVFLEIKRKDYDYISKDRFKILYNNLEFFLQNHCSDNIEPQAQNFLYYYLLYSLKPTALITYEREAFECKYGTELRITFDKNIRSRAVNDFSELFYDGNMVHATKGYFVLEVKFHQVIPGWLPRVLGKYNVFRSSASKYIMGIDNSYKPNSFIYI